MTRPTQQQLRRFKSEFLLHRIDQEVANDAEASARVGENAERVMAKLKARSSGKTYVPPRQDRLADREIFFEIQQSLRAGDTVRLSRRTGPPVIKRVYPFHRAGWEKIKREDEERRASGLKEKTLYVPPWDHTGDHLKALSWAVALYREGGWAFTLRLASDVIAEARNSGFVRYLRDRVQRHLRTEFRKLGLPAPDFFFVVEATQLGEPHVHGGISIPNTKEAFAAARRALKAAGGQWRPKDTGRQVFFRKLDPPVGWIEYVAKWRRGTQFRLGGQPVIAATNQLRSRARAWYESARRNEDPI